MNFLHSYLPKSIMFSFGPIQFYWYGFFISLALIVGIILAQKLGKKYKIKKDDFFNLAVYVIIFSLVGARLYYVLLELDYFIKYPLNIFKFWEGGLAIHGAIIGGLIAGYFYTKKRELNFLLTADIVAMSLALGQSIGRWGNYFNQELYGLPTNLPWGIPIDSFHRVGYFHKGAQYFHPTFLYESILNFCSFLFLLFLHKRKLQLVEAKSLQKSRGLASTKKFFQNGNIFLIYLLNYSIIRFTMEFIRIDETALIFGFRAPQLLSFLLFIFIVVILIYRISVSFPRRRESKKIDSRLRGNDRNN